MTDTLTPTPDACLVAHGAPDAAAVARSLVLIYAGEISRHLSAMAAACDYRVTVVEPDPTLRAAAAAWAPTLLAAVPGAQLDGGTDVVATDHHRADLGVVLRDALAAGTRWVGVLGNPRGEGPHVQLLGELGVPKADIARVHRPVGLNIGSRTPAEIAVSTLAGLLADRAGKPGGFDFPA
jgi:xanthine/CO dehydrogenase XdhC/CoxF family maturation factor